MSQMVESNMSGLLNDYIIKLLNKNRIQTVSEFLQEDANRLTSIMNIDLHDISIIKSDIYTEYGVQAVDGLTDYFIEHDPYVPTKIESLDNLLKGGLMTGNIIDICGSSAAGKTQLCTTIAINLAQHCDIEIFFVDTKGDFSGKRVHKILAKRVCTESDMEKIMKRLRVERINDPYQLVAVLNALIANRSNFRDLKVLVIDSLPALWFLFHGDKKSKGLSLLATAASLMRKLAVEYRIIILTVNLVTSWTPTAAGEQIASSGSSSSSAAATQLSMSFSKPSHNKYTPALGKFWQSICSTRLLINRTIDSNDCIQKNISTPSSASYDSSGERFIHVMKSNQLETGSLCAVRLTDQGVC